MAPTADSISESRAELRKSNKPLMEKRRRARINASLNQLKSLVLEAMKKDTSRYSKLEKADILDMTVKHLKSIQRQQMSVTMVNDPSVLGKYRAGFGECAKEVIRYLNTITGVPQDSKARLIDHLANRMKGVQETPSFPSTMPTQTLQPLRIQIPSATTPGTLSHPDTTQTASVILPSQDTSRIGTFQLVPGKLPSGEVAFFLPNSHQNIGAMTPQMVPIVAPSSVAIAPFSTSSTAGLSPMQTPSVASEAPSTPSFCDPTSTGFPQPTSPSTSPVPNLQQNTFPFSSIGSGHHRFQLPGVDIKREEPVWRPW